MNNFGILFLLTTLSNAVALRRDKSILFGRVSLLGGLLASLYLLFTSLCITILAFSFSSQVGIFYITITFTIIGLIFLSIFLFLISHSHREVRDYAYVCAFKSFFDILDPYIITSILNTIVLAIKDKYYNITCKEINIIFIRRLFFLFLTLLIVINFDPVTFLICRFICVIIFIVFVLPYMFNKYEKYLLNTIENSNVQDLFYKLIYNTILPFTIGISLIMLIYLLTNIVQWEILIVEGLIYMFPFGQGSSTAGTGISSSSGAGNGQGPQPPQGPNTICTYDKPTANEKKEGYIGSLRPLSDSETYEIIQEYKKNHPDSIVPADGYPLFDRSIDRDTEIGYWRSTSGRFYKYHMHSYHDKPLRIYMECKTNSYSRVLDACPRPSKFYYVNQQFGHFASIDTLYNNAQDKIIYVKNTQGQYVIFPLRIADKIKVIRINEDV